MTDLALHPRDLPTLDDLRERATRLARSPQAVVLARGAAGIAAVLVAFHYSLGTLVRTLGYDTPLAYLALVPAISLCLAAATIRPAVTEPAIHDRQLDYIVGVPMIVAALVFEVLMPVRMSTLFWLYRLDLIAFPLYVSGIVTLLFGVRTLWRLKLPVLFLLLAWPLPYTTVLVRSLSVFTNWTLGGLNLALHVVHVAVKDPSQGTGGYLVRHGSGSFPVSVTSACSGVNGFVGYLLVAVAFLVVIGGSWPRKGAWLAAGLATVWLSNVIRIFIILLSGRLWGENVAIGILHPFMGLVTFNLAVLAMVLLLPRFGLQMRHRDRRHPGALADHITVAVPKLRLVLVVVAMLALVGALANSTLSSYDAVVTSLGSPRLAAFTDNPGHPDDWDVRHSATYTWAKPFFGQDSTWNRFQFSWKGKTTDEFQSTQPVISDVINTSDVSSFNTYGIEACYRFHGFKLHSVRTVDLGDGVTGNVLAYYNSAAKSDWTTVYWHWPIKTSSGKTRYERVTLMLINTGGATFHGPIPSPGLFRNLGLSVQNALVGRSDNKVDSRLDQTRTFLTEFARTLIARQTAAPTKTLSAAPAR